MPACYQSFFIGKCKRLSGRCAGQVGFSPASPTIALITVFMNRLRHIHPIPSTPEYTLISISPKRIFKSFADFSSSIANIRVKFTSLLFDNVSIFVCSKRINLITKLINAGDMRTTSRIECRLSLLSLKCKSFHNAIP